MAQRLAAVATPSGVANPYEDPDRVSSDRGNDLAMQRMDSAVSNPLYQNLDEGATTSLLYKNGEGNVMAMQRMSIVSNAYEKPNEITPGLMNRNAITALQVSHSFISCVVEGGTQDAS